MPPNLVWVDPWQGEVDSSSLLAAVAGDDVLPDLAIGRLPVNSAEEMNIVVSKTLAYEQAAPQDWQRRLMFVADNTPDSAGDFVGLSEQAINNYAPKSYAIDRIYENNFGCQNSVPVPGREPRHYQHAESDRRSVGQLCGARQYVSLVTRENSG